MSETYAAYLVALWMCHEETVRDLSSALDVKGLRRVCDDLRPGAGGRWEGLPEEVECRRQLLLHDVATIRLAAGDIVLQCDLLPQVPDTAEAAE